jgi:protease-4
MKVNLQTTKEVLVVIILGLVALALLIGGSLGVSWYASQQPAACNVAAIRLYGTLVYYPSESTGAATSALGDGSLDQTASEDIRQDIEAADDNSGIKAILLQIDSPGGDPVAGEDVADALRHADKPTVALVADQGTSAAYWAATGARTIFASANSSLADIGVTQSYLQDTERNDESGLQFISLTAGKYKDMGNPDAPLTPEEKALFERDLNITDQNFIAQVAKNRGLSIASVTAIADGSSMLGQMALQDGLIDKIGNIYDVENYLKEKTGDDVTLCE